jgi:ADP-ribosylglycohydrolase
MYRARVRGCLLGGAVGDALGYPIEFASLDRIRASHGRHGVTGYVPGAHGALGLISDDTQMTLFTVEALITAHAREREKGIGGAWSLLLRHAYERWLETQSKPAPGDNATDGLIAEPWLYARRAPGNACLSGVAQMYAPDPWLELDGKPGPVNPDSKGCGTVMRSAPFGLVNRADAAFAMAARGAQITHGHPTGYYAAGAFAALIHQLIDGTSPAAAVPLTLDLLARYPGHEETHTALRRAYDLATEGGEATVEKLQSLGAGWVAEEALAIGVYAALAPTRPQTFYVDQQGTHCHPNPPRTPIEAAFLLSVNHSGDSDSTGSICGNLLGAQYGDVCLPLDWLRRIEGRAAIAMLADDVAAEVAPGEERRWIY